MINNIINDSHNADNDNKDDKVNNNEDNAGHTSRTTAAIKTPTSLVFQFGKLK